MQTQLSSRASEAQPRIHSHRCSLLDTLERAFSGKRLPMAMVPDRRSLCSLVRDDSWGWNYRPFFFRHAAKSVSVCSCVAG
jgi:hypothetical protein